MAPPSRKNSRCETRKKRRTLEEARARARKEEGKSENENEQSEDPSAPKPSNQLHSIPFQRCTPRWERPKPTPKTKAQNQPSQLPLNLESSKKREPKSATHLLDELEQLRLGRSRISEQQNVDVSSQPHPIGKNLLASSEQKAGDSFLDVCSRARDETKTKKGERVSFDSSSTMKDLELTQIPKNTRCHTPTEPLVQPFTPTDLSELFLLLGGEASRSRGGSEGGVEFET